MRVLFLIVALVSVALLSTAPIFAEGDAGTPTRTPQCLYYDPPGVWVMRDCPTSTNSGPSAQNQTPLSPNTSGTCSSLCLQTCFFTGASNYVCAALCCS